MANKTINQLNARSPTTLASTDNFEIQTAGGTSAKVPFSAITGGNLDTQAGIMNYFFSNPYRFGIAFEDFNGMPFGEDELTPLNLNQDAGCWIGGNNYSPTYFAPDLSYSSVAAMLTHNVANSTTVYFKATSTSEVFTHSQAAISQTNPWCVAVRAGLKNVGGIFQIGTVEGTLLNGTYVDTTIDAPRFENDSVGGDSNTLYFRMNTSTGDPIEISTGITDFNSSMRSALAYYDGVDTLSIYANGSFVDSYTRTESWASQKLGLNVGLKGNSSAAKVDYIFLAGSRDLWVG
jgi:hypothetical protein